jgi:trehalose 6-phosphate synthase/phosphatase
VDAQVRELRGERPEQLLVGIDRLDYTKGIQRRLMAFERLLRERPDLREKVRLVQVAVPPAPTWRPTRSCAPAWTR